MGSEMCIRDSRPTVRVDGRQGLAGRQSPNQRPQCFLRDLVRNKTVPVGARCHLRDPQLVVVHPGTGGAHLNPHSDPKPPGDEEEKEKMEQEGGFPQTAC